MTCFRALLALALAVSIGAGCSESSSSPTSPTSVLLHNGSVSVTDADLAGTWILLSIQPIGQVAHGIPAGATYTLTFIDGRLSTQADCNVCNGAFSLSGQRFMAGPGLACTRAACRTMEFENLYTRLLGGAGIARLFGSTLVLSSDQGFLRFTRHRRTFF